LLSQGDVFQLSQGEGFEFGGEGAERDEQPLPRRPEEQLEIDQIQSSQIDPYILEGHIS